MSIKAALFDLDDTLIERYLKTPETLHKILNQKGIQISVEKIEKASLEVIRELEDTFEEQRGKIPQIELYRIWKFHFLKKLEIKDHNGKKPRKLNLHWIDISDTRVYPDVIFTLTTLRSIGIKVGIVSDAYEKEIHQILEIVDLDENLFDIIVGPDSARKTKPDPGAFMYALRKIEIEPEEAIFVGDDLERDYKGAEKVGMKSFLILRSESTEIHENVRKIKSLISLIDYLD